MFYQTRLGVRDSDPRMQALRKSLADAGGKQDKDDILKQMEELRRWTYLD